jgi:GT2 family glycosyltransferase
MTSSALIAAKNSEGKFGFEPKLVMYKEDIELSLRVQKCGFKIFMDYSDFAYHCRGWSGARRSVPKWARWLSAKNDIFLARNYIIRALPYSVLKFLWVAIVENCRESPPREFNPASEE